MHTQAPTTITTSRTHTPTRTRHTHVPAPDGLRFSAEILSHNDSELDLWLRTLKEIVNSVSPAPSAGDGKRGKSKSYTEKSPR